MNKCPICGSKNYKFQFWTEFGWGIVEQHGYCEQCGYTINQAYSDTIDGFTPPIKKGGKGYQGRYIKKNIRKRKRYKRKYNIKYSNDDYVLSFI